MTHSLLLLVLLATSGTASAQAPSDSDLSIDQLARVDVRGTTESISRIAHIIDALPPARRQQAARSLRTLSTHCPYTRAALQLPFAMHQAVLAIDAEGLDPRVQQDWLTLQHGLSTHVQVLQSLDVDLARPQPGDHLYRGQHPLDDLSSLRSSGDPLGRTSDLIAAIVPFARDVSPETSEVIDHHSDLVEQATGVGRLCPRGPFSVLPGQPWTLGMQRKGWDDALRRIQPFVKDPDDRAQLEAMLQLSRDYEAATQTYDP